MPIDFTCLCGQAYTVPESLIGQKLRCPVCENMVVVPAASEPAVAADDEPVADFDEVEEPAHYGFAGESSPTTEAPRVDDEPEVVDEEPEVIDEVEEVAEEAEEAAEEDDAPGDPTFFVAAYSPSTSLRQPKTFRFYRYRDELLAVHAGPFGWAAVEKLADRPGVQEKNRRYDGFGHGMETDFEESVRKGLARRAAVLDRMTLDELRAETGSDALSFRITPENTTAARIEPPSPRHGDEDRRAVEWTVGRLKFTHAAAGKWDLLLVTTADVRLAIKAFRRVLGVENVEVTVRVK
jgi:hypothetical protein